MELLVLFIVATLALCLAAFWLGLILAGLPAAIVATGLWYVGVPLWLAIIIGIACWGILLGRLQEKRG